MGFEDDNAPRWGDFKALQRRYPGLWGRTKAYELLKLKKLRAKRLGNRTLWSFDSADELIRSLPDVGTDESK